MTSQIITSVSPESSQRNVANVLPVIAILASIYLQRFGTVLDGGGTLTVTHAVVAISLIALTFSGKMTIDSTSVLIFAAFCFAASVSTLFALIVPSAIATVSYSSFILLLSLYGCLLFAPLQTPDTKVILTVFNNNMLFVTVLGIAQFALQYVGLRLFTFKLLIPNEFLIEKLFNPTIPITMNSPIMKSNGVFFLEPSFFSQFLSVAILIEYFFLRRYFFIVIFFFGLVCSFSGSGPLVLVTSLFILGMVTRRYRLATVGLVMLLAGFAAPVYWMLPDFWDLITARILEVQTPGSSGYLRYVTPFLLIDEISEGGRLVWGYGAGTGERILVKFSYSTNVFTKILTEYGLFGLLTFFGYIFWTFFNKELAFLSIACLCWYLLGGGYHLTPCIIFAIASLTHWIKSHDAEGG
jgi:hypothetical protein